MDKQGLAELTELLPVAATMAGMHVGQNVITGQILKSNAGHKALASMARAGFQHGLAGQKMSPTLHRGLTFGIGPEVTADYQIANRIGYGAKRLMGHTPEERVQLLDRISSRFKNKMNSSSSALLEKAKSFLGNKKVDLTDAKGAFLTVRNTPGFRQVYDAATGNTSPFVDKMLAKVKTVPINQKASKLTNATHGVLAAAGTALSPEVGMQLALNSTRQLVGKSNFGQTFAKKQITKGFEHDPGKIVSTLKRAVISPRAAELQEMGAGLRRAGEKVLQ